jgi:hypothetical protein
MSRLLIVNSAGKAYRGKEVILIAGKLMSIKVLSECVYILVYMQVERSRFDNVRYVS